MKGDVKYEPYNNKDFKQGLAIFDCYEKNQWIIWRDLSS